MSRLEKNLVLLIALGVPALAAFADAELPAPDEETLFGKRFRFSWTSGEEGGFNGVATLRSDGTIEGIASPNEATWLVDGEGRLIFKHRDGTVSTVFHTAERTNERWRFEGPSQFREGLIHRLEEIEVDDEFENETAALNRLVRRYSQQQIVCLDVDETHSFRMQDGSERVIRLVSAREIRDSVIGLLRRAEVEVQIDGRPLRLVCAPYVMPTETSGLRIQADTTSGWSPTGKRVQLSVWDAADPIVDTDRFAFPIRDFLLFSHGTQGYNEAVHLGLRDGDPGGQRFCHDYGFDLAGYEGREVITSSTDGTVVRVGTRSDRPGSVVVRDDSGFWWHYGHLDSVLPSVRKGQPIGRGEAIGTLGKTGPSGNFSHLHLGTYLSEADALGGESNRRLNLYPWLVAAYQNRHGRGLFAVARPHHTAVTGEKVVLDGSHSLAWDAQITAFQWRLPDGTVVENSRAETVFDTPGAYVATLWAKDDRGREDVDFCKVKVFSRRAPEKSIPTIFMTYSPTQNVAVGRPVLFRLWLQAKDAAPIRVDFGDGTVIEEYVSFSEVSHAFRTPGIHVVTARATVEGKPISQRQKVVVRGSVPN
ncbi:MAG: PKD domain-containing protein [Planctomycetota bacterium]|jgi:murein DD-endopeptidase MepM/ murein hydrolase activator NlpD